MTADRVYAALLRLYPAEFRREYSGPMLEAFRELHRKANDRPARFWALVLQDLVRSALRERLEVWSSRQDGFALEWALACTAGAVITGALGSALTWLFAYFYHPYLEGAAFQAGLYGALVGIGLGGAQAVVLRRRVRLGTAWVLASAASAAAGFETATTLAGTASPLTFGLILGGFVGMGQWLILRRRMLRAAWWIAASAVALPIGVLSCGLAMHGALRGMNPLADDLLAAASPDGPARLNGYLVDAVDLLLRGLNRPGSLQELTVGLAVMAVCGMVVGLVTAKPLSSMLSRPR